MEKVKASFSYMVEELGSYGCGTTVWTIFSVVAGFTMYPFKCGMWNKKIVAILAEF